MSESKIKAAISVGDLNGIGLEVIMKTFMDQRMLSICTPVIYASGKAVTFYRKVLNIEFNFVTIRPDEPIVERKINVVNCWDEEVNIVPGQTASEMGKYAQKSLDAAIDGVIKGHADILITAPFNKAVMQQSGFSFPGHTEYLSSKLVEKNYLMLLVNKELRTGVATGHIPVKEVSSHLNIDGIFHKLKIMNESLKMDFGIRKPRIAVLGLNPHAGDDGQIGSEEKDIIIPAIKKAYENNILAFGPYAADGFFGSSSITKFDGILAMYHDQGLAPFKALSFESGVNYTAGLPLIRTSPDHGTAFDIAGKGIASENSFREAVYMACDLFNQRKEYHEINANPLPLGFSKLGKDQ